MGLGVNVLDLFSGIGGFSLGLERAGMRTVAFCEIEPFCQAVLRKHWPGVPIYDDVRSLSGQRLWDDGHTVSIQVICGGFPCQDVSLAGARAGLDGERSGLWREYSRLVGDLRPQFVIVENTPGLLSLGMGTVLGDLASLGYDAEWHCIPASAVGADHIRDRVWIIAYPNGTRFQIHDECGGITRSSEMGADAAHVGQNVELQSERPEQVERRWTGHGTPAHDADTDGTRSTGRLQAGSIGDEPGNFGAWLRFTVNVENGFPGEHWNHQPILGRGLYGIPNRVDRVGALGNSVVPQIPEIIGRAIMRARYL